MNSLETPKCNWNLFRPKEMFYMIPKCILVITKLSIIEMLSQWNWKNKKPYVVILSHWLFVKAMMIFFSYVLSDGNCNVNFELHLKIWMVVMVTIVFVDARWIESRFVVTAYNIEIVSCDFHGNSGAKRRSDKWDVAENIFLISRLKTLFAQLKALKQKNLWFQEY